MGSRAKKKALEDLENTMDNFCIDVKEKMREQGSHDEKQKVYFNIFKQKVENLEDGPEKDKKRKELEEGQSAAVEAREEMKKKLSTRKLEDFAKKSFDEGDQSPLVGREALILMNQWQRGMDYNPTNPFSQWMKAIYTGNYEGVMDLLRRLCNTQSDVTNLLSMRESLMNVPALLHVVMGAKAIHSDQPSQLTVKRRIEGVLDVRYDHMKILEKLIELGADLSVKDVAGRNILHHCFSGCGNPTTSAMAEVVLKAGLDPNIQDRFGFTPLFLCIQQSILDDVDLLLKYGADPSIKDFQNGSSSLVLAQAFPAVNKLIGKYGLKDAVREREKLKEEKGGSLKKCLECGKDNAERCKGCFVARYCSKACQKTGWKAHKVDCKETRAKYRKATLEWKESAFLWSNQSKTHHFVIDDPDSPSPAIPDGQFAVKVQVYEGLDDRSVTESPLLIYNRNRTLKGTLARERGQEELYDKLENEVRENGFKGYKGFFPAIYKKDPTEKQGYRLEINPDQMLPVETW